MRTRYIFARLRLFFHTLLRIHCSMWVYSMDGKIAAIGCLTCDKVYWSVQPKEVRDYLNEVKGTDSSCNCPKSSLPKEKEHE